MNKPPVLSMDEWLDMHGIDRAYKKDMKKTYKACVKPDIEAQRDADIKWVANLVPKWFTDYLVGMDKLGKLPIGSGKIIEALQKMAENHSKKEGE